MAGNTGGPWGGGGDSGGGNNGRGNGPRGPGRDNGGRGPGDEGPQIPEIEELVKKGQEQLRVLMGGRGGGGGTGGGRGPVGGGAVVPAKWLCQRTLFDRGCGNGVDYGVAGGFL